MLSGRANRSVASLAGPADGAFRLLVFTLDDFQYALLLAVVERVAPIVELTALPRAPEIVLGVVNFAGRIVPVVDIRRRFNLPARDIILSDRLILTRTSRRPLALRVDGVSNLAECPENEFIAAAALLPGLEYLRGVAKLESGIVLIHDLDTFLSLDEERDLDSALEGLGA